MISVRVFAAAVLVLLSLCIVNGQDNGLSFSYYSKTCPQAEKIVREVMRSAVRDDPTIPAAVLRLVFHDCQVGGCDGSVLLNIEDPAHLQELDEAKHFGLRHRELMEQIKLELEKVCPQQVSCADILVLAARDSVSIAGGPEINVPLGRRDTMIPHSKVEANIGLPPNNVNLTIALKVFASENGITTEEVIALLGSHTLGSTHCDGVMDRLYSGEIVQLPANEEVCVEYLKKTCPEDGTGRFTTKMDFDSTPHTFDNKYFTNILNGQGIVRLDAEFARFPDTKAIVEEFAKNQNAFFRAFSSGFKKITTLNILTGDNGMIRKTCSVFDS